MGELVERVGHAPCSGTQHTHHAVRIQVRLVRTRLKAFDVQTPEDIKVITQVPDEWNTCIQSIEGHSDWVTSVVFSPDGFRMASGSADNTVRVWDCKLNIELLVC